MTAVSPLCSFVVTIYNDAYLAEEFCKNFQAVFQTYLNLENINPQVELLFVNDGSTNDSIVVLRPLAKQYDFIKVIDLSRNFGQHVAIFCGYHHARGRYVGRLNVDMQDPPS